MKQSFDSENFINIFYKANKKGFDIERYYIIFKPVNKITQNILTINENFKLNTYQDIKEKANRVKKKLINKKHNKLIKILSELEQKIEQKSVVFVLDDSTEIRDKTVYTIKKGRDNPGVFFVLKQLQENIKNAFKINQPDRYEITNQVINMLDNDFPKFVIRTDIKKFFESIPHDKLKEKINKNHILNAESKRIIDDILTQYKNLTGFQKGVPRGVGISSYLSELYMRDIDNKIKALPNLTYYARYVDDMILIFTPNRKNEDTKNYLNDIKNIVKKEGLTLNEDKTKESDLRQKADIKLDFLGYEIHKKGSSKIKVFITNSKLEKYKKKINLAIEDYNETNKYNEKVARQLLKDRLKFLTGNTRLLNVKKDILVGIYFSNILLTNLNKLDGLDKYLTSKLTSITPHSKATISSNDLINKLNKYSFKKGFKDKTFYKFNAKKLKSIPKIWRNL